MAQPQTTIGTSECKRARSYSTLCPHTATLLSEHFMQLSSCRLMLLFLLLSTATPLCRYWQQGRCDRKDSCMFRHEGDPSGPHFRSWSEPLLGSNQSAPVTPARPRSASAASPTSTAASDQLLICTYNLCGRCVFGESCRSFHAALPYQWQTRRNGGWVSLDQDLNSEVEKTFCQPEQDCYQRQSNESE